MIKVRRKNFRLGGSTAVTLPKNYAYGFGESSTCACGSWLIICDPIGEVSPEDLHAFVLEVMEPTFWDWWRQKMHGN